MLGFCEIKMTFCRKIKLVQAIVVRKCERKLVLGINFWNIFGLEIIVRDVEIYSVEEPTNIQTEIPLDPDQRRKLQEVIGTFLISTDSFLGRTNILEHKIELLDGAKPFYERPYLFGPELERKMRNELDRMIERKVIEPSKSSVASAVVPVIKPNGKVRLCLDSRKVNAITKRDHFPLPLMKQLFARMPKAKFFSIIDLKEAFWQVPLSDEPIRSQFANSRELTAFIVPGRGLYQFKVMPFGLSNSAATQCRLMHLVIGHDLEPNVWVYLDDILIIAEEIYEMLNLIKEIAKRLRKANLSINLEKSKFFLKRVKYLGFILSEDGLAPDPDKIKSMREYPTPTRLKEVRRFLGLCGYYRRMIKDFSKIVSPLTDLLKNSDNKFSWNDQANGAFLKLKDSLCKAPLLANPNFLLPFHIQTDASDVAAAAVLGQGKGKEEVVIAYFSHKWNGAERKYAATEKEALAVILAIEHFRCYVYGRPFTVITDASALAYIYKKQTDGSSRLGRWASTLSQYQIEIKHRAGKESEVPDALSRAVYSIEETPMEDTDRWYIQLRKQVEEDPSSNPDYKIEDDKLWVFMELEEEIGVTSFRWREVVPNSKRIPVIIKVHEELCHLGPEKCSSVMKNRYYWPGMRKAIRKEIDKCDICK